jgi:RNA-binding protein YhbY
MAGMVEMQLGKSELSENFMDSLRKSFKRHENVKISLLKSFSRDKGKVLETADKIVSGLNDSKHIYKHRIIGFKINLFRIKKKSALKHQNKKSE